MPVGRGIVEVFEAIPDRIEVSGHAPTWRVTGGSFESVLAFAKEAFGDVVALAREDRGRWWPRVTLTVTQDPRLAEGAPPLETLADPEFEDHMPDEPAEAAEPEPAAEDDAPFSPVASLDEIFEHQERLRLARGRVPKQRG